MACELHEGIQRDMDRHRDDIAELYRATNNHEVAIRELITKDEHREAAVSELKSTVRDVMAELRGMITSLTAQVTAMSNARANRIASRWDDIFLKVLGGLVLAGAIAVAGWLVGKGGTP